MTDRQIQELLLTHYLFAEQMVEDAENYQEAISIADELQVDIGVCNCAIHFDEKIYSANWVTRNYRYGGMSIVWGDLPCNALTKSEILSRLKLRVSILNKEIQLSK
jgi:tRNA U34 2-thiouridine synthase MnmA/TrmU